jgi:hypothetical protein
MNPEPLPQQPIQQAKQIPVTARESIHWHKIVLLALFELLIVGGSVFIGINIGKKQRYNPQIITAQPTAILIQPTIIPTISPTTSIPAINPVTKWKIYTNEEFGFSIEYPDPVMVDEIKQNGILSVYFRLKKIDDPNLVCNGTHLTININYEGACGLLAFKGTTSKILESKYLLDKVSTTKYDDYIEDKHVETRLDTISQGKNNYSLNYIVTPDEYSQLNENHKLFNQMLATFKFIK